MFEGASFNDKEIQRITDALLESDPILESDLILDRETASGAGQVSEVVGQCRGRRRELIRSQRCQWRNRNLTNESDLT
jgi:hypothetical protein